jgi:hypothetical protein
MVAVVTMWIVVRAVRIGGGPLRRCSSRVCCNPELPEWEYKHFHYYLGFLAVEEFAGESPNPQMQFPQFDAQTQKIVVNMTRHEAEGSFRRGCVLPGAAWRLDELIKLDRRASAWERIEWTFAQHKLVDIAIVGDVDIESENTLGESLARSGLIV